MEPIEVKKGLSGMTSDVVTEPFTQEQFTEAVVHWQAEGIAEANRVALQCQGTKPNVVPLTPDQVVPGLPLWLRHRPTEKQLKVLNEHGYRPVWPRASAHHAHLLLSTGRCLAELESLRLITEWATELKRPLRVYDVGSNIKRLLAAVELTHSHASIAALHHSVPQVMAGDALRASAVGYSQSHCDHRFEDCNCFLDADVVLFQHSVYYVNLHTLSRYAPGTRFIFTAHELRGAAGTFGYGEGTFFMDDEGLLRVSVHGNSAPYVHRSTAWIGSGHLEGYTHLYEWEQRASFFETRVYSGTVCLKAVPGTPPCHEFAITDEFDCDAPADWERRLGGQIQSFMKTRGIGPGEQSDVTILNCPERKMYIRSGALFWSAGNNTRVVIPTDLIGAIASRMVGVPRDPVSYRTAYEFGKKLLISGNFPPNRIPRVLAHAVPIALFTFAEDEAANLAAASELFRDLAKAHSQALSGAGAKKWRWWHYLNPKLWWCCANEDFHTSDAQTFIAVRAAGLAAIPPRPITLPPDTRFTPAWEPKAPIPPQNPTGSVTAELRINSREPGEPTVRLGGISVMPLIPTTSSKDLDTLLLALQSRLLKYSHDPVPGAWEECYDHGRSGRGVLSRLHIRRPVTQSPEAVKQWCSRFPKSRADLLWSEWERVRQEGASKRDLSVKAMIKVEKSAMCMAGDIATLTPRVVVSYSDARQAVTGPYDLQIAKIFRKRFDPADLTNPCVWVNGPNQECFGDWVIAQRDAIRARSPTVHYAWGDNSRFEIRRTKDAFNYTTRIHCSAVQDPLYRHFRKSAETIAGTGTSHAVNFKVKYVLASGGTETSVDSFERNVTQCVAVFGEPKTGELAIAVNGDDWFAMSHVPFNEDQFHERIHDMGSESEFAQSVNLWDVEFCQSVPYPCEEGIAWGPKIGRVLSRLPWLTSADNVSVAGIAKGMLVACSHVPFLREYMLRLIQLDPRAPDVDYTYHICVTRPRTTNDETWAFVQHRYGLTKADLPPFIALLNSAPALGTVVHWEHGVACAERDE